MFSYCFAYIVVLSETGLVHHRATSPQMRKRTYGHLTDSTCIEDVLIEDIMTYNNSLQTKSGARDEAADKPDTTQDECPVADVHNLVGTGMIDKSIPSLDLQNISRLLPNCNYDKQKFAAITIRIHQPACTVLLFTSGKMVVTGCRSLMQCVLAAHEVVRLLRRGLPGVYLRLRNVKTQNIVGNVDLKLQNEVMDLDQMHKDYNIYSTYQKNMFPGLIFRPDHSPVVLLVFLSGKIVITGGKSTRDVNDGWQLLWPIVRQYVRSKV